jgi:hypothetical protein
MKSLTLISLVSAIALAVASVLSAEAAIVLFSLIGVTAIAVTDCAREIKPLQPALAPTLANRSTQALRLAA